VLALLRGAQFVTASFVLSDTTRGERRFFPGKCVDRFKARTKSGRGWVRWLQIAFNQLPENRSVDVLR
jgi:hypothetical protein